MIPIQWVTFIDVYMMIYDIFVVGLVYEVVWAALRSLHKHVLKKSQGYNTLQCEVGLLETPTFHEARQVDFKLCLVCDVVWDASHALHK